MPNLSRFWPAWRIAQKDRQASFRQGASQAGSPEVEVRAGQIDEDHRDLGTACTHRLLADAQRLFEEGRRPWVIALLAPDAAENQQGIGHLGMRGAEEGARDFEGAFGVEAPLLEQARLLFDIGHGGEEGGYVLGLRPLGREFDVQCTLEQSQRLRAIRGLGQDGREILKGEGHGR